MKLGLTLLLAASLAIAAASAQPRMLPCRAAWLAPKCDKAFADPERYQHLVRVCRAEGFVRFVPHPSDFPKP